MQELYCDLRQLGGLAVQEMSDARPWGYGPRKGEQSADWATPLVTRDLGVFGAGLNGE